MAAISGPGYLRCHEPSTSGLGLASPVWRRRFLFRRPRHWWQRARLGRLDLPGHLFPRGLAHEDLSRSRGSVSIKSSPSCSAFSLRLGDGAGPTPVRCGSVVEAGVSARRARIEVDPPLGEDGADLKHRCGKAERFSYRTPALIHTEALPFRFSGFARRTLAFETWDAPASAPRRLQGWPSAVCFAARAACTI